VIPQLAEWETFYVIVGSSAAALTGLMFVVITLIADSDTPRSKRTLGAFGTPTVVHFCAALVAAAMLSAPWEALSNVARAVGVVGVAGLIYSLMVVRWARRQADYKPVVEDWLFHAVFPTAAYIAIVVAAVILSGDTHQALFAIGIAVLALVLIGIHNAWDTVTYLAVGQQETPKPDKS
jgi:hypothetical protein